MSTQENVLDGLGFDYIAFDDHHFVEDLQWADAVPMLHRLYDLCQEKGSGVRREDHTTPSR